MGILLDISLWRQGRQIEREVVINRPDGIQTHVWGLGDEVGVIEKKQGGAFLRFRVEEGKPFGRVVGVIKRQIKRQANQGVKQ